MRAITIATTLIAVSSLSQRAAYAADIEAASHVDAVTVYPDGAMVARIVDLSLPQGSSTILVKGLPAALDPTSLRAEATASGALSIGSVETRLSPADSKPAADQGLETSIAELREERDKIAKPFSRCQAE